MILRRLSVAFALLLATQFVFAQNWGDNPETKTKYALLSDKYGAKDYAGGLEPLEWILTNAPNLHLSVYKYGETIYRNLESTEKDEAKKTELQNKLLNVLDQRVKLFGDEATVLDRKGDYAYNFLTTRKDKDYYPHLDSLYSRIFELRKDKMSRTQLIMYMAIVAKQKQAGKYNDDQVTEKYEAITENIELNIKNAKASTDPKIVAEADKWADIQTKIDDVYGSIVKIDCAFIKERLQSKFKENKDDLKLAKKIFKGMLNGKCTEDPLFVEVAMAIFEKEPDMGIGQLVAKKYLQASDETNALKWLEKTLPLADKDPAKKADMLMDMAKIYNSRGDKSGAREYAFKAAETSSTLRGEAYSFVGALYMQSSNLCKGTNPVEQRYCFLAAYDMYQKAGDGKGMANAQAQFPAMSDIFTYMNDKLGQSVSVGCWIGGTTTLRKRPN